MVHRAGVGEPYFVQLVDVEGRAGPWVQALSRSEKRYYTRSPLPGCFGDCSTTANYLMPETSVSATHVYFLDGESDVKSLSPAGTVKLVSHIEVPANAQAMFAVSPDDRQIAVAVLAFATNLTPPSFALRMYIEDLIDGGNRVDLFSSTTVAEWPVGWHAGNLVVAVGSPDVEGYLNPYAASGYHLVDPTSGRRLAVLDCASGPLVVSGTACVTDRTLASEAWDGSKTDFGVLSPPAPLDPADSTPYSRQFSNPLGCLGVSSISLSPDGSRIAATVQDGVNPAATAGTYPAICLYDSVLIGHGSRSALAQGLWPLGWMDDAHLLVSSESHGVESVEILDLATAAATPVTGLKTIPQQGLPSLFGVLPAGLG